MSSAKVLISTITLTTLLVLSDSGSSATTTCQNTEVLLLGNTTQGIQIISVPSEGLASSSLIQNEYFPSECGRDYKRCNIALASSSSSSSSASAVSQKNHYFIPAIGGVLSVPDRLNSNSNTSKISSTRENCNPTHVHYIDISSSTSLLSVIEMCDSSSNLYYPLHQINISNFLPIVTQRRSSDPILYVGDDDDVSEAVLLENQQCLPSSQRNLYLATGNYIYRTGVERSRAVTQFSDIDLNCSIDNDCRYTYIDVIGRSGNMVIYTNSNTAITFDSCDNRAVHHNLSANGIPYYCTASEWTVYRKYNDLTIKNRNDSNHVFNTSIFAEVRFGRCVGSREPYFVALLENGTVYIVNFRIGVIRLADNACGVDGAEHCTRPSFNEEDPNVFVVYDFGAAVLLTVNVSQRPFVVRQPLTAFPRMMRIMNRPGTHVCGEMPLPPLPPPPPSTSPPSSSTPSSSTIPQPVVMMDQKQNLGIPVGIPLSFGVIFVASITVMVILLILGIKYKSKICKRRSDGGRQNLSSCSSEEKVFEPQQPQNQNGGITVVTGANNPHQSDAFAAREVVGVLQDRRREETRSETHRNLTREKTIGASNIQ